MSMGSLYLLPFNIYTVHTKTAPATVSFMYIVVKYKDKNVTILNLMSLIVQWSTFSLILFTDYK